MKQHHCTYAFPLIQEDYCPKNDVNNMEWLMDIFEKEYIGEMINQSWAIDELDAGVTIEQLYEDLCKGYERWAEEYLEQKEMDNYWGLDERDID